MSDQYSADTARIRALKTSIVSLLDGAAEEAVDPARLERGSSLLVEAFQSTLNLGSQQLVGVSPESFGRALTCVDSAYRDWVEVAEAFDNILSDAYNGYVAPGNLMIDAIYNNLRQQIGEPIAALHAKLHTASQEHLRLHPWNEFLFGDNSVQAEDELQDDLKALVFGDHLDLEDALEHLTGPLRHAFAGYLSLRGEPIDEVEESLWLRPEIMLINDYWRFNRQTRLIDVVCRKGSSRRTASFARVQDLFAMSAPTESESNVVDTVKATKSGEKNTYYRCLMLHPDQQIRRYAVNAVDLESLWKVVTPHAVPCAVILSLLERVAGTQSENYDLQKVFFRATHRRLFNLTSRSELIYARGIIRIFSAMPFFMEDEYFEKLMRIVDYVKAKERALNLTDGVLDEYIEQLRSEKDAVGSLNGGTPNLTAIPPVVLRKLARDGHFWYDLAMHPMFKIARETVRHINTADRAARVAANHMINTDVLREVGRKRSLFGTLSSKMTLLSNPHTPPAVSLDYLVDLTRADTEALLRKSTVHPEVRLHLQRRLNAPR
jgi:hypothetical protein